MAEQPAGSLYLPRPGLRTIREHAEAAWPHEACGLLEGHAIGRNAHVKRVIPCRNEHDQPQSRYRIDPEVFLRADRAAEKHGCSIVGVWHSHPHGKAYFSEIDRSDAWPGWSYLVAGIIDWKLTELRCWTCTADQVQQQWLHIL